MRAPVLAVLALGCSGRSDSPPAPATPPIAVAPAPAPVAEPPPAAPDFPEGTRSLELRRTVGVRLEPGDDAKRIGTVAIDTRVAWTRTAEARGCDKRWVEIKPRGWVCGDYLAPSKKPAFGQEVPHLDRGELVPGVYGKVTAPSSVTYVLEKPEDKKKKPKRGKRDKRDKRDPKAGRPVTQPEDTDDAAARPPGPRMVEDKPLIGSINVRQYDVVTIDGKDYWKIDKKESSYVLRAAISQHRPSGYAGGRLGDDTGWAVPIAFVWPRGGGTLAWTTATAAGAGATRQLAARTLVPLVETAAKLAPS